MNEFEKILTLGKKMGGSRGGEVQLEDKNVYLTNTKRSSLYKITLKEGLGTGTFYSNQAMPKSKSIMRRENKVWFQWKENGVIRREFVPNLDSFDKEMEDAFKNLYSDKKVSIPKSLFEVLIDKFLITRLKIKDNKIYAVQTRSDGSVGFENEIPLSHGLIKVEYPDTEEISVFTSDLLNLKILLEDDVWFSFAKNKPLSVTVPFSGGKCQALIGKLIYE